MPSPRVTLDQWRALQAVVDLGSYALAAEHLHRSQSSVSYAIRRLEEQLGLKVLVIQGRKAVLTETGLRVLQRARHLLNDASELEQLARQAGSGWETQLRLVVDAAFPIQALMLALQQFVPRSRGTRVELEEVIMSGADDSVRAGKADIVIGHQLPPGCLGTELIAVPFIAVAHREHPLNTKDGSVTENDLRQYRQIVVRDSGQQQRDSGWLSPEQRWSVSGLDTSLTMVTNNMGFAWLPLHKIEKALQDGELKAIPLLQGRVYKAPLYLYYGHKGHAGPAATILSELLEQHAAQYRSTIETL